MQRSKLILQAWLQWFYNIIHITAEIHQLQVIKIGENCSQIIKLYQPKIYIELFQIETCSWKIKLFIHNFIFFNITISDTNNDGKHFWKNTLAYHWMCH